MEPIQIGCSMDEIIAWLEERLKEKNAELSDLDSDIDEEDYCYTKGYIYAYLNTLMKIKEITNGR